MLITSQTTTLLQIFCELLLHSLVIFKSMKVADDTSKSNSECEWVKNKCKSRHYHQLSFKYFVKSFFITKLLSKVSKIQTKISGVTLQF